MPDWSRYAAVGVPKDTLQRGLQSIQPFPIPVLIYSVAQGRAELHLTHQQPLEAQPSGVRVSTNPSECPWSSAASLSLPRIHTHTPRHAVPLPESQHGISTTLGGLQRCPRSFLQEKGFVLGTPGENLASHLDMHCSCSFFPSEWPNFCCILYIKHLGRKVYRSVILIIFYGFNYHDCSA